MEAARNYKGGRSGGPNDVPEDEPRPALPDWSKIVTSTPPASTVQPNESKPLAEITNNSIFRPIVPEVIPVNATINTAIKTSVQKVAPVEIANTTLTPNVTETLPVKIEPPLSVPIEEDLLISYDAPSQILNAAWDEPLPAPLDEKFPVLTSFKNPTGALNIIDSAAPIATVWTNHVAPVVPVVPVTPTVSATEISSMVNAFNAASLQSAVDPPMSPWDPDNPMFNAAAYYNEFSRKWHCPHSCCRYVSILSPHNINLF